MTRLGRTMNSDVLISRLIALGCIERVVRNGYIIPAMSEMSDRRIVYTRSSIIQMFAIEIEPGRFIFRQDVVDIHRREKRPVRTIDRRGYHSQSRNIDAALRRIPLDADGVRRSYGIEYEIYSLTPEQESELAYLLDTLPPHVTERDASLSSTGVEIVFEPMSREDAVRTVKTLANFVRTHQVNMYNTGMHITFGVSNSEVSESDLVIRTNRLALAVKAVGTQEQIIGLFGRDFCDYARIPDSLISTLRYRAFNVRNRYAWECRLVNWSCDIERVMKFFDIAEALFHRPFGATDFVKVFELLGADTQGA